LLVTCPILVDDGLLNQKA